MGDRRINLDTQKIYVYDEQLFVRALKDDEAKAYVIDHLDLRPSEYKPDKLKKLPEQLGVIWQNTT